ncbi:MAG: sulfotransferase [Candidatus Latescibacterota bacterium]
MSLAGKLFPLSQIPCRLRNQFMRTRFGQRVVVPFGRDLRPERWIFVVSCYDSGTTLLKEMLSQHPQIGALPGEGVRFTDSLPRPEEAGWNRLWCRCVDHVRLDPGPQSAGRARRIRRQWSILYPRRPNLLEKSIANAARIPFLQEHFQPAYFVYLVRNGYAAAEGIRRKARPGRWGNPEYPDRYPIAVCAEQWRETDRWVRRDEPAVERFLLLYYEDLTADPAATLTRLTDFLGLAPMPDHVLGRTWRIHGVLSSVRNMNPASFARLTEEDKDAIEAVAGPELARHGYGRPVSGSSASV